MLRKYLVRDGFTVHRKNGSIHDAGQVIDLDDDEAELHAHQVELVRRAKKERGASDDATTGGEQSQGEGASEEGSKE